jgi:serine/threonine-protein kinase
MPAKVILELSSGPIAGKTFVFDQHDTFLFGRGRDCHAIIPDPKEKLVSRHHFILEANPPDARIRDLGSRNGTYVNGKKYGGRAKEETPQQAATRRHPEVDLKHGDRITVGKTTIEVKIELPLTCRRCGSEVPAVPNPQQTLPLPGSFLCETCRGKGSGTGRRETILEVFRCERCGKDVSAEATQGRRGEYLCRGCQTDVLNETGGLRRLIQDAARQVRGSEPLNITGYEIGEELGKGGMGAVYKALRKADGCTVAVKVMLAKIAVDERARKRFLQEIDIVGQLRHPHVVSRLDSGSAGSAFYFVMEYCSGGSLDQLRKRRGGRLSLPIAIPLLVQCLDGLAQAHDANFVHRDLKPQNILLGSHAGRTVAKITDFGLAKNFEAAGLSGMTATGSVAGTFHFMPREQLTNFKYFQPVSDLWSLAATFYHAVTGCCPLDFPDDRDEMEVILQDEPVPIRRRDRTIPPAVAEVIDRALGVDCQRRYQAASELKDALRQAIRGSRS